MGRACVAIAGLQPAWTAPVGGRRPQPHLTADMPSALWGLADVCGFSSHQITDVGCCCIPESASHSLIACQRPSQRHGMATGHAAPMSSAHASTFWLRGLRGSRCHRSKIMDLYCISRRPGFSCRGGGAGCRLASRPTHHATSTACMSRAHTSLPIFCPGWSRPPPLPCLLQHLQLLRIVRLPRRLGPPARQGATQGACLSQATKGHAAAAVSPIGARRSSTACTIGHRVHDRPHPALAHATPHQASAGLTFLGAGPPPACPA